MNKIVRIMFILLLTIMLMFAFGKNCFAYRDFDGSEDISASASSAAGEIGSFSSVGFVSNDINDVKAIAQKVLSAIRNISIIVAIIMISILGIQYMVGSAEQKASYKKAFIPMIVGVLLVVSAAQIATMLFNIGNK